MAHHHWVQRHALPPLASLASLPVLIQYLHMCTCAFVDRFWTQGVFVRGGRMAHAWLQPSEAHVGDTKTLSGMASHHLCAEQYLSHFISPTLCVNNSIRAQQERKKELRPWA